MIVYWEIRAEPSLRDSQRRRLYIDGDADDVSRILVKLGNFCGRPAKTAPPYTWALYLYRLDSRSLSEAEHTIVAIAAQSAKRTGKPSSEPRPRAAQNPSPGFIPPSPVRRAPAPDAGGGFPAFVGYNPTGFLDKPEAAAGARVPQFSDSAGLAPGFAREPSAFAGVKSSEPFVQDNAELRDAVEPLLGFEDMLPPPEQIQAAPDEVPPQLPPVETQLPQPDAIMAVPAGPHIIAGGETPAPAAEEQLAHTQQGAEGETPEAAPLDLEIFMRSGALPGASAQETAEPAPPPPGPEFAAGLSGDTTVISQGTMRVFNVMSGANGPQEPGNIANPETFTRLERPGTFTAPDLGGDGEAAPGPAPAGLANAPASPEAINLDEMHFVDSGILSGKLERAAEPADTPFSAAAGPASADATQTSRRAGLPGAAWTPDLPLTPDYAFENLMPAVNRFAHAAGASVADNPGKLYNPLVLFGPQGSGKTHFLNAIAYALGARSVPPDKIYFTDGTRLSRGMQRLMTQGRRAEADSLIESAGALFIDDLHLLVITPENREPLSRWFNSALSGGKQVVMTSAYPPKNLARLEESLGFRLAAGWMVELKPPSQHEYLVIIRKLLENNGIILLDEDVDRYFAEAGVPLSLAVRTVAGFKKLEKILMGSANPGSHKEIMDTLSGFGEAGPWVPPGPAETDAATPAPSDGSWGRWAFFCPKGEVRYANWLAAALAERAATLNLKGGFEMAFAQEYDTAGLAASAFRIADACQDGAVSGALITLPSAAAADRQAAEEFVSIVSHMLETMLVPCSCVEQEKMKSPAAVTRALMELLPEGV